MEKVSLVVITKNEELNIERCLNSVNWVDEKIVLDSQSNDRTVEIAKKQGATCYVEPFRGFREQKARATELARNDWILSLDADEALSPELSKELERIFSGPGERVEAYRMPRLSHHLGRWIKHGGWYPDYQVRLFHRKKASWVGGHVHERVEASKVETLRSPIHHYVFKDLSDQVDTNNEYSSKGAHDLFDKSKSFSYLALIFKPISKFLETYIWKRGFLDGLPGFIISVGAAYSIFLKYAKLWELEERRGKA